MFTYRPSRDLGKQRGGPCSSQGVQDTEVGKLGYLQTLTSLYFIFLFLCLSLYPTIPLISISLPPKEQKSFFQGLIRELQPQLQKHVLAKRNLFSDSHMKRLSRVLKYTAKGAPCLLKFYRSDLTNIVFSHMQSVPY